MATQVLIAHTGQRLEVDASQFSTIDELKSWVSQHSSVPLQHIVALTPQGRSVKSTNLHAEKELYVYDIRVTHESSSSTLASLVPDTPLPPRLSMPNAPNSIDDVQAISSWQGLYQERRAWALNLAAECARLNSEAVARYDEMDVMIKCLDAAVANLEISVKQIEPKYNELKKWVDPALAEHETLASMWEHHIRLARNTPVSPAMVNFMTQGKVAKGNVTLEDLIEPETARKAAKLAPTARRRFGEKAATLDKLASQMYQGLAELIADFDKTMNSSALGHSTDSTQLLDDIEAVVRQIDSDYRTALGYSGSQRDLAQVSKTASNHTERLVPSLKKRAKEMDELVQYATEARNSVASESVSCMRTITDVTSLHTNLRSQINVLNQSEDDMTTFDYLRLIHQLPYMYASFVVEAIRRREWVDKVKTDSSTLANEMALFQDEESKRRRKWHKMVGSMYGPASDSHVIGLEVNLLGEDLPWPSINKDDLDTFLQTLREQETDHIILKDIEKLLQELHSPTKQQSRRLKAFKNGSVHEAALGRSGLLIRGDDDLLRSLQDDKSKMESKLKTAESRVRRLEDLLHRHSQASRPGNLFQPQNHQPRERRDSTSSVRSNRRPSDGADPLLRRITQLENELREEKQKSTRIQRDLSTRVTEHDDMKDQIQEANSTKKDLLGNMEALKREFLEERKSLEDEIKSLKGRLEENEDEMEHFDASRENEKATFDGKIQELESQVEKLAKEKMDEALKAQGQVEYLRKEAQKHREQLDTSFRQAQEASEEVAILSKKLREAEELNQSQLHSLHKIHVELCPEEETPADLSDLVESSLSRIANLTAKLQNTESDSAMVKADLQHALASVKELKAEIIDTRAKLTKEEDGVVQLRESVSEEKSRVAALENELANARDDLSQLRARLSAGETGSETLQKKLESEERKVSQLTEDLASRQSQVGSLEEELHSIKQRMEDMQIRSSALTAQYDARDSRTKDLTQRLYAQSERLIRLLERCGYTVARKPGEMIIAKVARSDRAAQNPNDSSDPGNSLRRSVSLGTKSMVDSADLELMYWMDASDAASESEKYSAFLEKLGSFDTEVFAETMYVRIKEAEHKARKWQREARAYRDRAHTQQKNAHEKIAFKNFKEGDLALFLPTRNQQAGAWAAFNVGFPHYFLRETEAHRLRHREWLVARISRIQERVVDLSKSLQPTNDSESFNDDENDNPFQLSDGLRWYLLDAQEDKAGAPSTPGMGKSTVASNKVEATADIQSLPIKARGKTRDSIASIEGINKSLSKSLESRGSSSGSKKTLPFATAGGTAVLRSSALASETNSLRGVAPDSPAATSPVQAGPLSNGQFQAGSSENMTGKEKRKDMSSNGGGGPQAGESSAAGAAGSSSEVQNVDTLLDQ
ncbi:Autophagy-related protein 11 [Metarhizium album ARSEF 1941]|uniref:Autophagy-related protein 11 n=1 Tax=Metarhizium album (strain ARSEF 1941) TaxID=1081103 RepID=A0A0B2X3Z0_METAS|nr:Autophagy-related protein 11 [Metarhizium album ARSEF 1941]KHO00145.1 Autophagy-related protein 11 [Metarhizium album ARSEF 1941]